MTAKHTLLTNVHLSALDSGRITEPFHKFPKSLIFFFGIIFWGAGQVIRWRCVKGDNRHFGKRTERELERTNLSLNSLENTVLKFVATTEEERVRKREREVY